MVPATARGSCSGRYRPAAHQAVWQERNGEWTGRLSTESLKMVGPFPSVDALLDQCA